MVKQKAEKITLMLFIPLIICIFLLSYVIKDCTYFPSLPKDTQAPTSLIYKYPQNTYVFYNHHTYKNMLTLISPQRINNQIGMLQDEQNTNWKGVQVYQIKGLDPNKVVAIQAWNKPLAYMQVNNEQYWLTKLPILISLSVLIIITFAVDIILFIKYIKKSPIL